MSRNAQKTRLNKMWIYFVSFLVHLNLPSNTLCILIKSVILINSDCFRFAPFIHRVHVLLCCVHGQVQSASEASGGEAADIWPSSPSLSSQRCAAPPPTGLPWNYSRRSSLIYGDGASSSGDWVSLHTMCLLSETKTPCLVWRPNTE